MMLAVLGGVTLSVAAMVGCSSHDVARVASACDLLTSDEVGAAVGAEAQPGVLTNSIGETEKRICAFPVSGGLGTVLVYLGEGAAPATSVPDRAVEARGDTFVIVFSQNLGEGFPPAASDLARLAIHRAARG